MDTPCNIVFRALVTALPFCRRHPRRGCGPCLVIHLLGILLLAPASSLATVMANPAITIDDLRFSSTDPSAQLLWTDVWRGAVAVQAQDSLGGTDADDAEVFGNDEFIEVEAETDLAAALASYGVTNGPGVARGSGDVEVITGAAVDIPNIDAQASAIAVGDFDNFFVVTGGTPGTAVDVTFELDYIYLFDAFADQYGFFEMSVFAQLLLEDLDDTAGDLDSLDFEAADSDILPQVRSGTNTSIFEVDDGTLSVSATLIYDEEYFLFAEADSEVIGINELPLPGVAWLMVAGMLPLLRFAGQRSRRLI